MRSWGGVLAAALVLAACSATPPAAPGIAGAAASTTTAAFDGRLSCADSITNTDPEPPATPQPSGVAQEPYPEITVESTGLRSQNYGAWFVRKKPIGVPIGTTETTVEVFGDDQRVVLVPALIFTTGASYDVDHWATHAVILQPCADRRALFLGGVIVASPRTCLHMRISRGGRTVTDFRERLDGVPCP